MSCCPPLPRLVKGLKKSIAVFCSLFFFFIDFFFFMLYFGATFSYAFTLLNKVSVIASFGS